MEIVVKGRNVEVPDHFRIHVADKLGRIERYDPKIIRVEVELSHENNPRQAKTKQRVQITLASKGPAVRAEANSDNFYAALDSAITKLETRLRRAADRRHDARQARVPIVAVAATAEEILGTGQAPGGQPEDEDRWADDHSPGRIVRVKDHPGDPITVDQALERMELVGHDFYLFKDVETQQCSVVYRRRGFDYGLLRLAEPRDPGTVNGSATR